MAADWQAGSTVHAGDGESCCYLLGDEEGRRHCATERRPGSSYCPEHHALCHIAGGTSAEVRRLREVEALATAVGGRRGNDGAGPSRRFLKKLEQAVQPFS